MRPNQEVATAIFPKAPRKKTKKRQRAWLQAAAGDTAVDEVAAKLDGWNFTTGFAESNQCVCVTVNRL